MHKIKKTMGLAFRNVFSGVRGTRERLSLQIKDLITEMNDHLEGTESRFLDMGMIFQSIHQETGQFTDKVARTMASLNAQDEQSCLTDITTHVARSVKALFDHQKAISDSLAVFEKVLQALSHLSRTCEDTDKISLLLNVIALNIGIESNRAEESRDMFKVFIEEVKVLAGQMKQISHNLYTDSESIRQGHILSMEEIRRNLSGISDLAQKARKEMDESALYMKTLMDKVLESLDASAACTRDMTRQAGEIVVALQFHDIIRQKIEHIIASLSEGENMLVTNKGPLWACDYRDDLRRIVQVLTVQDHQLSEIISEIQGAQQGISQALQGIDGKVVQLYRESVSQVITGKDQGAGADPFNRLMACMRSIERISTESGDLSQQVEQRVEKASVATAELQKHVDEVGHISLELHRKALNAIIKADHLGDLGRGIEVFAQEVTTSSQDTTRFAESVVQVIQSVREMTRDLADQALVVNDPDAQNQSLSRDLDELAQAYAAFQDNIHDVAEQYYRIEENIKKARRGLDFFTVFERGMSALQEKVQALIALGNSFVNEEKPSELFWANDSHYTMESERIAHARAIARNNSGMLDERHSMGQDQSSDVMFFEDEPDQSSDVMLFGEEPEPSSDVILFEETPTADDQTVTHDNEIKDGEDDDSLGDNVELF